MFYEVAKTAKAMCLVTGNKDHFPKEAIVKKPQRVHRNVSLRKRR